MNTHRYIPQWMDFRPRGYLDLIGAPTARYEWGTTDLRILHEVHSLTDGTIRQRIARPVPGVRARRALGSPKHLVNAPARFKKVTKITRRYTRLRRASLRLHCHRRFTESKVVLASSPRWESDTVLSPTIDLQVSLAADTTFENFYSDLLHTNFWFSSRFTRSIVYDRWLACDRDQNAVYLAVMLETAKVYFSLTNEEYDEVEHAYAHAMSHVERVNGRWCLKHAYEKSHSASHLELVDAYRRSHRLLLADNNKKLTLATYFKRLCQKYGLSYTRLPAEKHPSRDVPLEKDMKVPPLGHPKGSLYEDLQVLLPYLSQPASFLRRSPRYVHPAMRKVKRVVVDQMPEMVRFYLASVSPAARVRKEQFYYRPDGYDDLGPIQPTVPTLLSTASALSVAPSRFEIVLYPRDLSEHLPPVKERLSPRYGHFVRTRAQLVAITYDRVGIYEYNLSVDNLMATITRRLRIYVSTASPCVYETVRMVLDDSEEPVNLRLMKGMTPARYLNAISRHLRFALILFAKNQWKMDLKDPLFWKQLGWRHTLEGVPMEECPENYAEMPNGSHSSVAKFIMTILSNLFRLMGRVQLSETNFTSMAGRGGNFQRAYAEGFCDLGSPESITFVAHTDPVALASPSVEWGSFSKRKIDRSDDFDFQMAPIVLKDDEGEYDPL